MNRFWGRNHSNSTPRFTRENDQILALNYENLCDSEYLNRLFLSSETGDKDDTSNTSNGNSNSSDAGVSSNGAAANAGSETPLNHPELPEDVILFGKHIPLGRLFLMQRYRRDIPVAVRNCQDPMTLLITKQAIVFEHVGKLMLDTCTKQPDDSSLVTTNRSYSSRPTHVAETALDCTLLLLEGEDASKFRKPLLEPLVAIVFHITLSSTRKKSVTEGEENLQGPLHKLTKGHVDRLRKLFLRASQSSVFCQFDPPRFDPSGIRNLLQTDGTSRSPEENLDLALTAFYGLLALSFYTNDTADVITAIGQLMILLLRMEEWNDIVKSAYKAASSAQSLSNAGINQPLQNGVRNQRQHHDDPLSSAVLGLEKTAISAKAAIKMKQANHAAEAGNNGKLSIKPLQPAQQLQIPQYESSKNLNNASVTPSTTTAALCASDDEATRGESSPSVSYPFSPEPVSKQLNAPSQPQLQQLDQQHSNSSHAIKTLIDKEKDLQVRSKIQQVKGLKLDGGVAGKSANDLLELPLLNSQHQPIQVYHVAAGEVDGNVSKVRNNNNNENSNQSQSSKGHNNNSAQGNEIHGLSQSRLSYKQKLRECRETLHTLMRVPKPMLKLIFDACSELSTRKRSSSDSDRYDTSTTGKSAPVSSIKSARMGVKSYVWSCGQNSYGELGLGDVLMRKNFTKVKTLDDKSIVSIGAGNEHSLFVTHDGRLMSAGYNDNGQCGIGSTQQVRQPTVIQALEGEEIAQVHVYNGCEHTLGVTKEGKLFSFGYNYRGQLGLGNTTSESTPRPVRGLLSRRVVLAACSYHHSLILCADGSLFSCGRNDSGQLGHGDTVDKKTPQCVLNCPRNIISISCGQFHTVAASSSGAVFVCGKNDYGQLGLENSGSVKALTKLPRLSHELDQVIVQVCCGYYHTILLSNAGIVAGFGRNDYGQLGLGHAQPKVFNCTVISSLRDKGVHMLSAGCYHSVAITSNGMLYVFGRNNHGQLATGDLDERHNPHPVDDFVGHKILSVAAGFYHTIVLTADKNSEEHALSTANVTSMTVPSAKPLAAPEYGALEAVSPLGSDLMNETALANIASRRVDSVGVNILGSEVDGGPWQVELLKDASLLTRIHTDKAAIAKAGSRTRSRFSRHLAPFSSNNRSKVTNRELLLFMVNHVQALVSTKAVERSNNEGSSQLTARENVCSDQFVMTAEAVGGIISSMNMILHVCRCIIDSKAVGQVNLPFSYEEALVFILKVTRLANIVLVQHHDVVFAALQKTQNKVVEEDSSLFGKFSFSVEDGNERGEDSFVSESRVTCAQLHGFFCHSDKSTQVYSTMAQFRKELLAIYFTSVRPISIDGNTHKEILRSIVTCLTQSHSLLLPCPAIKSKFFDFLAEGIIDSNLFNTSLVGPNGMVCSSHNENQCDLSIKAETVMANIIEGCGQHYSALFSKFLRNIPAGNVEQLEYLQQLQRSHGYHHALHVKIITGICSTYRRIEEVVKLFQKSKESGLKIFRTLVQIYNFFSTHNSICRALLSAIQKADSVDKNSTSSHQQHASISQPPEIRRLVSVLDHCIANFIKCGMPVIFASSFETRTPDHVQSELPPHTAIDVSCVSSGLDSVSHDLLDLSCSKGNLEPDLAKEGIHAGIQVIREMIGNVDQILDFILKCSFKEEMVNQLRYSTLIPSILPSLLLYGMAFTRYQCLYMDLVPSLRSLVKKMQLISKSLVSNTAATPDSKNSEASQSASFAGTIGQKQGATIGEKSVHNANDAYSSKEEFAADMFADDIALCRKDPQQVTWLFRLTKLTSTFISRMAVAHMKELGDEKFEYISRIRNSLTGTNIGDDGTSYYRDGDLWSNLLGHDVLRHVCLKVIQKYSSFQHSRDCCADIAEVAIVLRQDLELQRASRSAAALCSGFREEERTVDPVYKMLSLSTQSMFSRKILNEMEDSIMETVLKVLPLDASNSADRYTLASVFKSISRMTKHIHSHRSAFLSTLDKQNETHKSDGEGPPTSWVEMLTIICNAVKHVSSMLVHGDNKISQSVPLLLPSRKGEGSSRARMAWRRAIMVVMCLSRWKIAVKVGFKQIGNRTVDFIFQAIGILTDDYSCVPAAEVAAEKLLSLHAAIYSSCSMIEGFTTGIRTMMDLLQDLTSSALRTDVLCMLLTAYQDAEVNSIGCNLSYQESDPFAPPFVCDASTATLYQKNKTQLMRFCVKNCTDALNSDLSSVLEVNLVLISIKILHYFQWRDRSRGEFSYDGTCIPMDTIEKLVQVLTTKQINSNGTTGDDKGGNRKNTANYRERNAAYRRSCQCLLSYFQTASIIHSASSITASSGASNRFLAAHNNIIRYLQEVRSDSMRSEAISEESTRLNLVDPKDVAATGAGLVPAGNGLMYGGGLLSGNPGAGHAKHGKDASKRRCQDLILKPMEFCRSVEGTVIQGEKLLNNYKGVDFTVATWLLVAHQPVGKHSFITGKVSHNDAWPLILLRSDGKLDILYGHSNEFERITTEAVITPSIWTHIACIVEQKKIKVFINGSLDCQVSTKGNARAVLFPLLIGSSPSNVRTRVAYVKEGFDGMLAQYKYYSRALSPIHVKVIYDHGPPENNDATAKLVYQLLASLKNLVTSLHGEFHRKELEETMSIAHNVFVTDSNRRNRYAALEVISNIATLDTIEDLEMHSGSMVTACTHPLQPILASESSFLGSGAYRKRFVRYFLRIAGICWAPHILTLCEREYSMNLCSSSCGTTSEVNDAVKRSGNSDKSTLQKKDCVGSDGVNNEECNVRDGDGNVSSQQERLAETLSHHVDGVSMEGRLDDIAKVMLFLHYCPAQLFTAEMGIPQLSSSSGTTGGLVGSGGSVVEKLAAKEEFRSELCHQCLKFICKLSLSALWRPVVGEVIRESLTNFENKLRYAFEGETFACGFIDIDAIGCSLLLGGGTGGIYLGSEVRNFYGDGQGVVVNINKTVSSATLLAVNSLKNDRQLLKLRLSDLVVEEQSDVIPLHYTDNDTIQVLMDVLERLAEYMPLLLSDFMSILQPTHSFQSKTLLKCLRPTETFIFSQFMQALVGSKEVTELESCIKRAAEKKPILLEVLILAANGVVQHIEEEEDCISLSWRHSPSQILSKLWLRCSNFIINLPNRVRKRAFIHPEDDRMFTDFISRQLGISLDSILISPHVELLRQGRLSELVHAIASNPSGKPTRPGANGIDVGSNSAVIQNIPFTANEGDTENNKLYLISDWSDGHPEQLNPIFSSSVTDQDCANTVRFMHQIRKRIVLNCRNLLANRISVPILTSPLVSLMKRIVCWESICNPAAQSNKLELSSDQRKDSLELTSSAWCAMSDEFYETKRLEVTHSLASSIRYSALSLLQLSSLKTADNILETTDLLKRTLLSANHWLDYCDRRPRCEEVYILLLRFLLPSLSFIENPEVELKLMHLCLHIVRKLSVRLCNGYQPSRDLMDLVKSNNFTLLRARAQEQLVKFKNHNLGDISAMAYNLTQLVTGLELIQRQGSVAAGGSLSSSLSALLKTRTDGSSKATAAGLSTNDESFNLVSGNNEKTAASLLAAKVQTVETASPSITGLRSTSVDTDLVECARSAASAAKIFLETLNTLIHTSDNSSVDELAKEVPSVDNIIIEIALGTGTSINDCCFETVYCGTSLRFVQSGLVPDCTYYIKCRAYYGAIPLQWSPVLEFHTQKGVLFTFDSMKCGPDILLGEDLLTASYANDDTWSTVLGSRPFSSGVTHWEIRINQSATAYVFVGVASSAADLSSFLGGDAYGWGFIGEQALYHNREKVKVYGESFSSGDIVGVTLDMNHGTLTFSKNHKSLGVAFEKIFGELYPAVAFYNVGQELEILPEGFKTNSPFESIPISPSRLNMDDISMLNELVLSVHQHHPLSHRLQVMVAEQCNQWLGAKHVRCRALSGKDIFLAIESPLLKRFNLHVGERVRSPYGAVEVAGSAFNMVWFRMNPNGEVWFFSNQQIIEGKSKKLFMRCSYHSKSNDDNSSGSSAATSIGAESNDIADASKVSGSSSTVYDAATIQDLIDPVKWSNELDQLLIHFLQIQSESAAKNRRIDALSDDSVQMQQTSQWSVSSEQVCDNFRSLQQQLARVMLDRHQTLAHRWGISGPKRKAVLARIGLLRQLNQMLDMYLPFLIADSISKAFAPNQPTITDSFNPVIVSLNVGTEESIREPEERSFTGSAVEAHDSILMNERIRLDARNSLAVSSGLHAAVCPPFGGNQSAWPLTSLSWDTIDVQNTIASNELFVGALHSIRRLIFTPLKLKHFWEVVRKTTTRPAKTDDDYDYPDDLPHVKINRLKSFRAREASQLMGIPGEDLMMSSMFCQLWRELRQHNDEKLRISYTHPMDDGQSRTFKVKFEGEGVDDYGGPYRETFQQICEELQSAEPTADGSSSTVGMVGGATSARPAWINSESNHVQTLSNNATNGNGLEVSASNAAPANCFLPLLMPTPNWTSNVDCAERYRYSFHPAARSPMKMDLFHFLGQMVGIAIRSRLTIDLALPSYIWKCVVGEKLEEKDIASFDAPSYDFLQRLASIHQQLKALDHVESHSRPSTANAAAVGAAVVSNSSFGIASGTRETLILTAQEIISDLTWSWKRSDGQYYELKPGGAQLPVAWQDIEEYMTLYSEARLSESRAAIVEFRRGLVSIIPESALSLLTWEELQSIVCGAGVIEISRLKANTEYDDDISSDDEHIQFFWEVLEEFSEAEKSSFLRFVWARPTLPPRGVEFSQKMRILSAVGDDAALKPDQYLPKAHTCFFSINLPKYSSKQLMADKLRYAISNCTEMDADFRTTESEIAGWGTGAASSVTGMAAGTSSGLIDMF